MGTTARSGGFRYTPGERHRPLHDAGDVLAPRGIAQEKAGGRVNDVLERRFVETGDRGLFLIEAFGIEPGRDFLFDGGAIRPAIPGFVAAGPNGNIDGRIHAVRTGMPGVEHLPAALIVRRLLRATRP